MSRLVDVNGFPVYDTAIEERKNDMNTVTIYTNYEDAEKLAVILIRSEFSFYVEICDDKDGRGYLFTVSEREDNDE